MRVLETTEAQPFESRKKWTRQEAQKLAEMLNGQRYELIEGDLICKMGQNPPHAYVIRLLANILVKAFGARVQIQSPVRLPDPLGTHSEPEPDAAVLRNVGPEYFQRLPGPQDVDLLIEVADTSLEFDRTVKYNLYARAGIAEYWIIDLPKRRTIVCRQPAGEEYKSVTIADAAEEISPVMAPDFVFCLGQVLP